MKATKLFAIIFLFFFICIVPSSSFAYNKDKEQIVSFVPDTGNMNERDSDKNFAGTFKIETKSTNAEDYKVNGVVKNINVAVYVSWQNNNSYSRIFTDSFKPVDSNGSVVPSKEFNFSTVNPSSWKNPMAVIIVAQFDATPSVSPQTTYNGRGDILKDTNVETPPAMQDVQLGFGSTYYEGLKSFDGSLGEIDVKTGNVKILMTVLVEIFRNPLGGCYDPTPEGIGVFADLTGGTNPTTRIYGETKLAGAYWRINGIEPKLPFDLPFYGEWTAGPDIPGVIVGGPAMAWGSVPVLGSNCTWGQQNRVVWYLPPKRITFTPDSGLTATGPDQKMYEIYDGMSFGATSQVELRTLQIESRVGGFEWFWGDGSSMDTSDKVNGRLKSSRSHIYRLENPEVAQIFNGYCNVHYQNSTNNSTDLHYPFDVSVKPLPAIYPKNTILVKRIGGGEVTDRRDTTYGDLLREDLDYSFTGTGKGNRLITTEDYKYNYSYYYKIIDPSAIPTELTKNTSDNGSPLVYHKFKYVAQGQETPFKRVELYIRYMRGELVNGELKQMGWTDKLVATRYFNLGAQDALEDKTYQRIAFLVKPASSTFTVNSENLDFKPDYKGYKCASGTITELNPQTVTMTFNASASIFYGGRFENDINDLNDITEDDLDRWNGVATGSVYYRWRVLTPDGEDAFEKGYVTVPSSQYNLISDFNTKPHPILNEDNNPAEIDKNRNRIIAKNSNATLLTILNPNGTSRIATEEEFPTGIKPITLTFKTPYGNTINPNRFYKVFVEAKYKDIKWSSNWTFSGWKDETKGNQSVSGKWRYSIPTAQQRYIANNPCKIFTNNYKVSKTLPMSSSYNATNNDFIYQLGSLTLDNYLPNKESGDVLYDFSIGYLVKINDAIPARIVFKNDLGVSLKNKAFTGDPIYPANVPQAISIEITDNNPDTIASYIELIYDRYDEANYNMIAMKSVISDLESKEQPGFYKDIAKQGNFNTVLKTITEKDIYNSLKNKNKLTSLEKTDGTPFVIGSLSKYNQTKRSPYLTSSSDYSSYVAFYSDTKERFPDSYALTMKTPKYHDLNNGEYDDKEGKFFYRATAFVDDGIKQHLETDQKSFEVVDNDIPNVKVTLVNSETGESSVFELIKGVNDPQLKDNQLARLTKKVTIGNESQPYIDSNVNEEFIDGVLKVDMNRPFVVVANERFLCNIEVIDNVLPPNVNKSTGQQLYECASFTINAYADKDTTNNENKFQGLHPTLRRVSEVSDENDKIFRARSGNPIQFYLSTPGETRLKIEVEDNTQGDSKKIVIDIPIQVFEEKIAKIRVLDQRHEK